MELKQKILAISMLHKLFGKKQGLMLTSAATIDQLVQASNCLERDHLERNDFTCKDVKSYQSKAIIFNKTKSTEAIRKANLQKHYNKCVGCVQ